jgi:hypothetical protein
LEALVERDQHNSLLAFDLNAARLVEVADRAREARAELGQPRDERARDSGPRTKVMVPRSHNVRDVSLMYGTCMEWLPSTLDFRNLDAWQC